MLDLIADKWTPVVLYCLSGGTRRFSELHRQIPDISKKMLIQSLRRLERDGILHREVYAVVPPKTEYSLTDLGRRMHEPIALICDWAVQHSDKIEEVLSHRRASEAGTATQQASGPQRG
ncbi:MAG: helix-turn-helix transcriptional regulator [Rhodobiaceae bacterium]|nr:helix-turn-helix transcriptional regulator [Rhodobiaceae bacterium]